MQVREQEVIWRRVLDEASFEQALIVTGRGGVEITGTVLIAEDGVPLRVDYAIQCDENWSTRVVTVRQSYNGEARELRLDHDGAGGWTRDFEPAPDLAGCTDIDLGVSPSTNALPVNRLALKVGERGSIRAAWVLFPSLEVVRARQGYERLGEWQYRYSNLDSDFEAVIDVDDLGMPVDYAQIWRRIAKR